MRMIYSNPHTHTNFVDGKNSPEEMVVEALSLGFKSLGFSEHAIQPGIDSVYGLSLENRAKYKSEIENLKIKYAGEIRVWLGMEVDRISTESCEGLDYFIGANHYFTAENGDWSSVDGDADLLEAYVGRHFGGDWDKAICRYFDDYASFIERRPPSFIAHFDLIRKNNLKRRLFDEDGALLSEGKTAMERMIKHCDLMEINLGGMLRSGQISPYPAPKLLKHWQSLGGRVIASTDCHDSKLLGGRLDWVEDYMRKTGFCEYALLGSGDRLFETAKL